MASSGATSIYGLSYDTSDPNAGKVDARKNAWSDALAKARQYGHLSGRKLGKVLVIEEVSAAYYPYIYRTGLLNQTPADVNLLSTTPGSMGSAGNTATP